MSAARHPADGAARVHPLLKRLASELRPGLRVAVVGAHPEDESVGAAALLSRLSDAWVICLTDGAPRDRRLVPAKAPASVKAYARLRRRELQQAMALAGVGPERVLQLGVADLQASEDLPGLVNRLTLLLRGLRPQLVLTHPYEGGHPDHDAAAFVLRAVGDRLLREDGWSPGLAEMLSYHLEDGTLVSDRFLAASTDRWAVTLRLTPRERRLRREMLACFASQAATIAGLDDRACERFRPAPHYDFARAPHEGELHYERLGLGVDGTTWRRRAAAARRQLAA